MAHHSILPGADAGSHRFQAERHPPAEEVLFSLLEGMESHPLHVAEKPLQPDAAGAGPWGPALRSTLPAADQGTLEGRLAGLRVRAKTGSIFRVNALSGYVTLPSGLAHSR